MSDNDNSDIPPALSEREWSDRGAERGPLFVSLEGATIEEERAIFDGRSTIGRRLRFAIGTELPRVKFFAADVGALAAIIAVANAAMNDEDPRKIRREHVTLLREIAERIGNESIATVPVPDGQLGVSFADIEPDLRRVDALNDLADVFESYLPPTDA